MPSGRHNKANQFEIYNITIDVGAADRIYTFYADKNYRFEALEYAAAACDSTDKVKCSLTVLPSGGVAAVYISGTDVTTADTPSSFTTLASTAQLDGIIPAGAYMKVTVDFSGTAANVKGVAVSLKLSLV